jgi:hypothetical protein
MTTIDDVRALASQLPRSSEALVQDRVKFRVGRIVYLAFSRDESALGFRLSEGGEGVMLIPRDQPGYQLIKSASAWLARSRMCRSYPAG